MKVFLAAAALSLFAAAAPPPWQWSLPRGIAPPPVPPENPMSQARVELGRLLFYDADLSADGTLACAGCHEQKRGFADGNATHLGVHGDPGRRNVPGLANVAWLPRLTYADPSATTLEMQALIPLVGERPVEMGMKGLEAQIGRRLGANPCYRRMFRRAFPQGRGRIDLAGVAAALAAFQRTMVAFDSPNDRFMAGDETALSADALRGKAVFDRVGCAVCHGGRDFTDAAYHRVEAVGGRDPGLAEHTGQQVDIGRFRTPSLRNVSITGPWWHDGSASRLELAVRRHGKGAGLSARDMGLLLAFLDDLTDRTFLADPQFSRPDRACGKPL
ncbi:cytochrome-c peroxidase [Novosphingobium soli]|uniref:Cytochrome-c peroxidase n=1 Tax=Novosphingobium soli TaxID=574956 RepID=A0ABV6CQ31_9SPHN